MYVDETVFKTEVDLYLYLATKEDVLIMRDGKPMFRVSSRERRMEEIMDSLCGALKGAGDPEELLEQRVSDYFNDN
ncbi:MAG: hypothetical protein FWF07_01090 [Methanomassiliicoccaceae archaeon]|nr:hypothetical protein [Methanomassiliicoccaceae archaeon]